MTDLLIGAGCVFVLLAIPVARWCMYEWRQMAHAKHIVRVTEEEAAPGPWFYGSMNLEDERDWRGYTHPMSDWREATRVELSPEALDSGPGVVVPAPTPGPDPDPRLPGEIYRAVSSFGQVITVDPDPGPGSASLARRDRPGPDLLPIREDAQRRDERVCATDSRPAAGADLTGSLSSRPLEEDPGPPAHGGPGLGPASLAIGFLPAPTRLADTGDITEAHENHPHPGEDWLDAQLADLFAWVRTQLEAAA